MKTYLIYGAGMTFVSAVLTLVTHILGYWTDPEKLGTAFLIGTVGGITITVLGIIYGTKAAREPSGDNGFSYGQAFKAGLFIALFCAVFGIVFNVIYFHFINPDFAETSIAWTRSFMEKMGAPESQIDKQIEEMRTKTTLARQLINGVISTVVIGALVSLITAAIMKRAPKEDLSSVPPLAS